MKKFTVWEWIVLLFSVTICAVVFEIITAMALSRVPTTTDNQQLRMYVLGLIDTMFGAIIGIVGSQFVNKNKSSKDDDKNDKI